jgi:ABC-type Na+ efflux pump permease subunit
MALNNMVAHDDFKKAFDFRQITGNISNLRWGKYIGTIIFTVIVMTIISVAVGFVLSFITVLFAATVNNQAVVISFVLAIIEGLFIDSYMAVFLNRVFGSIYRESIK